MVQGPVSKRRVSRLAVRKILLAAGVAVLSLAVLIGAWLFLGSSQETSQKAQTEERQARAGQLAGEVANGFRDIRNRLAALAGEPQVVSLFEGGEAIELAGRAADFEGRFANALNLRFLLPGGYTLDDSSVPPLSYACLDVLGKAEKGKRAIPAEVHLFGGPDQHIVMVERVRNEAGDVIGLIHLSLDPALFEQLAGKLAPGGDGYLELRQAAGGDKLVLARRGQPANKRGKPVTAAVDGSRWQVAYWSAAGGTAAAAVEDGGGGGGLLLPATAVALILLLGGGFLVWRRRQSAPGAGSGTAPGPEGVVYGGAVKNIMDGAHPGMEELVPDLPKEKAGSGARAAPSEALSGADDITVMPGKQQPAKTTPVGRPATAGAGKQQPAAKPAPAGEEPRAKPASGEAGGDKPAAQQPAPAEQQAPEKVDLDPGIFRAYDIRGVVGRNLTPAVVDRIGRAIASEARDLGEETVVVGRDGRKSSPELAKALIAGLRGAGCNVIDIGEVPTPVLYYATHTLDANSGVMLTGSHNGPEYNGLKIVIKGDTLSEAAIQKLCQRIRQDDLASGNGELQTADVIADYVRRISEDIPVALGSAYKLVVDCGNGVAGAVAPQLFRALGHDVEELYCEVDGSFPNHHPDPSQPENMQALIDKVKQEGADLGFAFDGDGDRLGVVDARGNILWPDRQLMILARDVLSRNAGAPVIFDVKCSRYLKDIIEEAGGKPLMWKTGHSLIKAKMKEVEAPLAGEMSGHIFFKERWYGFDDALYTAARLLEVLVNAKANPTEYFAEIPEGVSTPELRIELSEDQHQAFMQQLEAQANFDNAELIQVDGLRVEFPDGWGLIRPSNTSPYLVLRFEADDEQALTRIQGVFRDLILAINPDLKLPF